MFSRKKKEKNTENEKSNTDKQPQRQRTNSYTSTTSEVHRTSYSHSKEIVSRVSSTINSQVPRTATEKKFSYPSTKIQVQTSSIQPRLSLPLTPITPSTKQFLQSDAKPFSNSTNSVGYQSPFQRRQGPLYSSFSTMRVNTTPAASAVGSSISLPVLGSPDVSAVPTYETNSKRRGKVLVINNIKFISNKDERKGAEIDEICIKKLFQKFDFDVKVHRDLKKQAMKDKIKSFKSDSALKKVDISVVVMMSHGTNIKNNRAVPGGYTEIIGTDGEGLAIHDVIDEFTTDKCPAMKGKPKIFIFQCCRGDQYEDISRDDVSLGSIVKHHADMLIAYSTLPGFYSLRDNKKGSWYIQSICEVFDQRAKQLDVESMLKIVDDMLSKKHDSYHQTSTYESRGFKRCFIYPRQ